MISLAIIGSATTGAIVELRTYHTLATSKFSYVAAEAGIEDIFYRTLTGKQIPASETIKLNNASSTVVVMDISGTQRDVYATGNAKNEIRKVYLSISNNKSVSFAYAAQVGAGGITMSNNATIDSTGLVGGNVYSDGQIVGSNGSSITGNVISASGLIADQVASSTSCVTDEIVGKTNPTIDYAESFIMSGTSSSPLASVSLYIKRNGNPTGANLRITADNSGKPATTALATEDFPYSSVSTNYGWVKTSFENPPTLDPGTKYWIVLDTTLSSSKYWTWCRSNSDTYATGTPLYKQDWSTSGSWSAVAAGDMTFETTFGAGVSKIDGVSITGNAKADTITNSTVTKDAYYQTISGSTVNGTSHPGSPTPPYVPLPFSSTTIAQWESDATAGGVINGNCGTGGNAACNTFPLTLGPKKINGNLSVDGTLTVSGTLYVTGKVSFSNGKTVKCALAYAANSCLIIADGTIDVSNNAIVAGSGNSASYLLMLSTLKGCMGPAGDSEGGNCLSNDSAINVSNNVSGGVLYATDSFIDINNNAVVTAVIGYGLSLSNNTEIKYDPIVSTLSLSPSSVDNSGTWNSNRWNEY